MGRFRVLFLLGAVSVPLMAQVPGEVQDVAFGDGASLSWEATAGAELYHVYRGDLAGLRAGDPPRCHGFDVAAEAFTTPAEPEPGAGFVYLVTAESSPGGEGTPGSPTAGGERDLRGRCAPVMRNHVLDRLGYGWTEWTRDRVAALGLAGYIDEQLRPDLIGESDNDRLNDGLALWGDPPADIIGQLGRAVVGGVYGRRQLEWEVAAFWANHFNTFWAKLADIFVGVYPQCQSPGVPPQCDDEYPAEAYRQASLFQHRETELHKSLTFRGGNFRMALETNAMSPAMILYLDTFTSVAGIPNENYPRELLELYAMGVDGGYTQADVEELARVFTGWTICPKLLADLNDPLAPCVEFYWRDSPVSEWVAHFVTGLHDCAGKVLFSGTPYEAVIPDTCGDPDQGVDDVSLALDAIAAHPSTARFISKKLLQRFVADEPDEMLVDDIVAVWNDPGNPNGVGDLHAVLTAVLTHPAFLDPDRVGSKVKTPVEQFISAIRALDGTTDGVTTVLDFMVSAQHIPFYNPVPTGYSERGDDWVGTNNVLERQNFGLYIALVDTPEFGSDPVALLNANGVSTAPGNAEAIVDFLADALFGGALTPAERQAAIDYLNVDENGTPAPYDDVRIGLTAAYLLGYAQFQEQ